MTMQGERFLVVDDVGVLARITPEQCTAALQRGEVRATANPVVLQLVPRPIRHLTPAEKRTLEIRRQKAAKR